MTQGYTVFSIPVGVVYRPNEAKVKNLRTKDYLGKARLVAASDRSNAFTGFQGSELRKVLATETAAKDDRPAEAISYAATNLVQKNLTSRSRQQSEPPLGRNTFPPTPPPESDKSSSSNVSSGGLTQRAASVRSGAGGRPPRLELDRPGGAGTNGRTGGNMPSMEKSRIGTSRTASEPRGPPSRQYSNASRARDGRPRLYRETTDGRRGDGGFEFVPEEEYNDEVFDMYISPRSNQNGFAPKTRQRQQSRPRYIEEEPEYSSEYEDEMLDDAEFEMMNEQRPPPKQRSRYSNPQSQGSGQGRRAPSRRRTMPEIRKFRVKVHALEDTRYIMIEANIGYGEFEGRIREKFGFKGFLRIRMRDDNDMITMGDQEDLDMLLNAAKDEARRENQDMGKLEVTISVWIDFE